MLTRRDPVSRELPRSLLLIGVARAEIKRRVGGLLAVNRHGVNA